MRDAREVCGEYGVACAVVVGGEMARDKIGRYREGINT